MQAESPEMLNASYFQVAKHPKDPITLTIAMMILKFHKWDSLAKGHDELRNMHIRRSEGHGWRDPLLKSSSTMWALNFTEPRNIPIFCASPHSVQRPVLASINHPNLHKLHATSSYSSENHKLHALAEKYDTHDHIPRFFMFFPALGSIGLQSG